jgi:hypothetical protein
MLWTAPTTGIAMCQNAVAMAWQLVIDQLFLIGCYGYERPIRGTTGRDSNTPDN